MIHWLLSPPTESQTEKFSVYVSHHHHQYGISNEGTWREKMRIPIGDAASGVGEENGEKTPRCEREKCFVTFPIVSTSQWESKFGSVETQNPQSSRWADRNKISVCNFWWNLCAKTCNSQWPTRCDEDFLVPTFQPRRLSLVKTQKVG